MTSKAVSLRLPEELWSALAAIARTDGVSLSQAIREAVDRHIASRRADHAFQERLKKRLEEEHKLLKRLSA